MYRIIGGDQKEYGPVTGDELRRWLAEGRLNGQSLARAEGATEWKPLASFPEFADALRGQAGQAPTAATPIPPLNAEAWSGQVLAGQPEVQIGRCLSRSWDLLKANFCLLFGATFLVWLIGVVCERIPLVGLGYLVLRGVLYGGLYLIFLKRIRGQPASVGEVFVGFRLAFVQLMLVGLVSALLAGIGFCFCFLPWLYLTVAWVFSIPLVADKGLEFWSAMELSRKVVTRVWFPMFGLLLLAFLPTIAVNIFATIKIGGAILPALQDLFSSGPPDPGQ